KQFEEVLADDVVLRISGDREQMWIAIRDGADDIEQNRRELDRIEHLPEPSLRLPQRLGDAAAFVDVDRHRHARATTGQTNVVAGDLDGDDPAVLSLQANESVARRRDAALRRR